MKPVRIAGLIVGFGILIAVPKAQPDQSPTTQAGSGADPVRAPRTESRPALDDYSLLSKVGGRWVYELKYEFQEPRPYEATGTLTVVNNGEASIGNLKTVRLSAAFVPSGVRSDSYVAVSDEGVFVVRIEHFGPKTPAAHSIIYEPPLLLLKHPPAIGTTWVTEGKTGDGKGGWSRYSVNVSMEARETISVPAGQFDALRIVSRYEGGGRIMEWRAPNIGVVRFEMHHVRTSSSPAYRLIGHLVQYAIPAEARQVPETQQSPSRDSAIRVEGFTPGMPLEEAENILRAGIQSGLYKPLRVWAQEGRGRPAVGTETSFTPFTETHSYVCREAKAAKLRENYPVQYSMVFGSSTAKAIQLTSYLGRLSRIAIDPLASYATLLEALDRKYGKRQEWVDPGWDTVGMVQSWVDRGWETGPVRIYLRESSRLPHYSTAPGFVSRGGMPEPHYPTKEERIEFILFYEYRPLREAMMAVLKGKCGEEQRKQKVLPKGY